MQSSEGLAGDLACRGDKALLWSRECPSGAGKVYAEDIPVEDVAAMCPLVFSEAERGDEVARQLSRSRQEPREPAVAALKEADEEGGTISYAGGVFSGGG